LLLSYFVSVLPHLPYLSTRDSSLSLEESLSLWSQLLIEDEFLIDMRLLMLGIHLLPLVLKQHVLHLAWIEDNLAAKSVSISCIALEQDNRGPILARHLGLLRSASHKSTVDLVAIDL